MCLLSMREVCVLLFNEGVSLFDVQCSNWMFTDS